MRCGTAAVATVASVEHFNFYQVAGLILQPPHFLRVRISRIDPKWAISMGWNVLRTGQRRG